MQNQFVPPAFKQEEFNCPICGVYSHHDWFSSITASAEYKVFPKRLDSSGIDSPPMGYRGIVNNPTFNMEIPEESNLGTWTLSFCTHCKNLSVWDSGVLIFPSTSGVVAHHPDMPEIVAKSYEEARSIVGLSPRSAAALLRLALQLLMPFLGQNTGNLNTQIGNLVKQGLPAEIQQSLDILRVVGNNAVHPGEIRLEDDSEIAIPLFGLINFIVENRISEPQRISQLYASLPQSSRNAIEKRDNPNP